MSRAQAPAASPTPAPNPSPAPTPPSVSNPALYLPVAATVQVAGTTSGTASAGVQNGVAKAGAQSAGASTAPAVSLQINSPCLFSPTSLAAQPQPATITLAYNAACAGASVVVAPIDGGSINGTPGGQAITIGAGGTLVFSFQAPPSPGRYHVVTRLGNAEIALPFNVPDPALAPPALPASAASN